MDTHDLKKKRAKRFFAIALAICLGFAASIAAAQEAPDALIKRVSQEVLDIAKTDKDIQGGNRKRVMELVEEKVFPYVDFQRTTAMAAGRAWHEATPDQQQKLANEFRRLLIHTYAGALSRASNQQIKLKPFSASPSDTEVVVRSEIIQPEKEPIQLDYRLEKTSSGWKIFDLNIYGAWLIETYKSTFSSEIKKSGIDGLIKTLADKNNKLASAPAEGKTENPQQK